MAPDPRGRGSLPSRDRPRLLIRVAGAERSGAPVGLAGAITTGAPKTLPRPPDAPLPGGASVGSGSRGPGRRGGATGPADGTPRMDPPPRPKPICHKSLNRQLLGHEFRGDPWAARRPLAAWKVDSESLFISTCGKLASVGAPVPR